MMLKLQVPETSQCVALSHAHYLWQPCGFHVYDRNAWMHFFMDLRSQVC